MDYGAAGPVDFIGAEEYNGARFSWNVWPSSRVEAKALIVPLGCLYTPLKSIPDMPAPLPYHPIRCKGANCTAVLNPYCQIDFRSKLWTCPFCLQRNHFPPHYAENIAPNNLPAELIPQYTTIEYELPDRRSSPPVFVYVVDCCLETDELNELKDSIHQSLNLLPPNALVSLITFGKNVAVHELSASDISRSYMFKAKKNPKNEKEYIPYATADVAKLLNINPAASRNAMGVPSNNAATSAARFIQPVSECEFVFESILDDLQRDPWPKVAGQRPQRVSGVALNVASSLLEATSAYVGARIMLFLGGPPTEGTGRIAGSITSEFMRQHVDIEKNNTPYLKEAQKFYKEVSEKCVKNNHAVDMFACSLDQIGLLELQPCIQATGGLIVLADSFGQSVFKESFRRLFRKSPEGSPDAGNLMMGFAANMEVLTSSREFKINGAIGPCSSLKKDGPCVSEVELGEGKTNAWSLGSIFSSTTVGLYFEVVNLHTNPLPVGHRWHLQFITNYQASNGGYRIRVTTLNGPWHNDEKNRLPLQMGFDQEAASVLTARLASYKTETESREDVLRWVDRGLIRLCKKFADYRENEVNSFQLANEFRIFPQFMFHLRRSQFLNYFNSSPDESTYYRLMLRRENTTNSLVMIQPALLSYSFHGPPQPVLLDACSVASDTILLLDTFFHVVVFHGTTIAMWKAAGYHEQPDHVHFKNLLQAPRTDAQLIMEERFPVPRYILCDEGKSESRFLMAKLNPSVTHNNRDGAHAPIFTEDVSLRIFMEHLMKLTVSPA